MIDALQELQVKSRGKALCQRYHRVVDGAAHGRGRGLAHDRRAHHGSQGVHVGPGPLRQPALFRVLLDRRITWLEHRGQRLRQVSDDPARGAQIQQHRHAVGLDDDVVGRDVAVQTLFRMQQLDRGHERHDQRLQDGLRGEAGIGLHHVAQRNPGVIALCHVGGAVRLEDAVDLHQRRMFELGEKPCFLDEAAESRFERRAVLRGSYPDGRRFVPKRKFDRQIFLERDPAVQGVIEGQVDDGEATFAQDALDLEFG
ncbi:MAG: hypothetical protein ABI831_11660 [Betaproteobacteria bacterium]